MPLRPRNLVIGLVQFAASDDLHDLTANREAAKAGIRACVAAGAQVICLQELFTTQYFCRSVDHTNFDLAEPLDGTTVQEFAVLGAELGVVLVLPFFERRMAGVYHNSAVVIDADGTDLGVYRKMHIPDDPGFHEKYYFRPGGTGPDEPGYRVFQTKFGTIGVLICWDQWFPEAARAVALAGAEVIFYPTAIGWKPGEPEEAARYHRAWQTVMRGHAIANGLHVVAVNRVGQEGPHKFWGGSFIADTMGDLVLEMDDQAGTAVHTIDLTETEQTRREWPFLRDVRFD